MTHMEVSATASDLPDRSHTPVDYIVNISFLLLFAAGVFAGCARMQNPNIERGTNYRFEEGHPETRVSALGFFNQQGDPGLNITADIVYGSLIFKGKDGVFRSGIDLDIKIAHKDQPEDLVKARSFSFDIVDSSKAIVNSQDVFTFEKRIEVEPGDYKIYVTVTDQSSGKKTTRTVDASMPAPGDDTPHLTSIQLLSRNLDHQEKAYIPVTTYDVPGKIDSVKFRFQVSHQNPDTEIEIETRLLRFKADSTAARSIHFNNYSPSSLPYKGIDLDKRNELQKNTRILSETGNILIEYNYALPRRGNYRFEARIINQEEEKIYKARDFAVKSENYPAVESTRELARPLYYLMKKDNYEKMMSFSSTDSIKKYMDQFWLKNIKSKSKAQQVISKYYKRVEEANKQFSNFKEGWKTDPGYMYILFGPPWYVEQNLDAMRWSYSYNRQDPEYNFVFYQPKMRTEFYPFEHYLLRRQSHYYNIEYQQRQLWLSGRILTRELQ